MKDEDVKVGEKYNLKSDGVLLVVQVIWARRGLTQIKYLCRRMGGTKGREFYCRARRLRSLDGTEPGNIYAVGRKNMELKYSLTFKRGEETVATIVGYPVSPGSVTVEDATSKIIEAEHYLEKMTGLRVHINQVA